MACQFVSTRENLYVLLLKKNHTFKKKAQRDRPPVISGVVTLDIAGQEAEIQTWPRTGKHSKRLTHLYADSHTNTIV